jgi:hypothetical protein
MRNPSASRVATRHQSGAQSADERYHHHLKNVQTSMKNIQRLLDKHLKDQSKKPTDWGFVGDMGKVSEDLKDIETFLR